MVHDSKHITPAPHCYINTSYLHMAVRVLARLARRKFFASHLTDVVYKGPRPRKSRLRNGETWSKILNKFRLTRDEALPRVFMRYKVPYNPYMSKHYNCDFQNTKQRTYIYYCTFVCIVYVYRYLSSK